MVGLMRNIIEYIAILFLTMFFVVMLLVFGNQKVGNDAVKKVEVKTYLENNAVDYELKSFVSDNKTTKSSGNNPVKKPNYITDEQLATLYSLKTDERKTDDKIVELTTEEAMILMQVAMHEAGDDLLGEMWTMRTVLNRIESDEFEGDTLIEVLSVPGQFTVYTSGDYKNVKINATTHLALAEIEKGWDETEGAVYWESSTNSEHSWHRQNLKLIADVNGQRYYK